MSAYVRIIITGSICSRCVYRRSVILRYFDMKHDKLYIKTYIFGRDAVHRSRYTSTYYNIHIDCIIIITSKTVADGFCHINSHSVRVYGVCCWVFYISVFVGVLVTQLHLHNLRNFNLLFKLKRVSAFFYLIIYVCLVVPFYCKFLNTRWYAQNTIIICFLASFLLICLQACRYRA